MNASLLKHGMNLWPPFWGAGIKVVKIAKDFRSTKVTLKHRILTGNIVGVLFGGSLFSMTDPFFMLMVSQNLGKDYIVWDREAKIEFLKPGRSDVHANFVITQKDIDTLIAEAASGNKVLKDFCVEVIDKEGDVVAKVTKTIYVRKK